MDLLAVDEVFEVGKASSHRDDYGIIAFSHLRWKFVWQRPQQFLSRFAKRHPVLFVELTEFDLAEGAKPKLELETVEENVTVATVHLPVSLKGSPEVDRLMRQYCRFAIEAIDREGRFDDPLLWFYSPMDAGWALGHIAGRGVVYDCMDELSQFKGAPPELIEREKKLMNCADVVFTGGHELWLKKRRQHPNAHFFGCGVEFDHFNKAQDRTARLPSELQDVEKPVVGWFGVVDERVDYDLLAQVAALRPNYEFVLVGPVVKVDPAALPQAPNIRWLGGRDYKELPDYCRAYDVCMMCFALNEATEFINPTKALEYLATGRPVVSTPVSDVVRQYSDCVLIGKSAEEFAAIIDQALQSPDQEKIEKGLRRAKESSWERTVEKMQVLIDEAVGSSLTAYLI